MAIRKNQSRLEPFKEKILELRGVGEPMSFPEIARILKEDHQLSITPQAIHSYLKTLAKGYKPCKLTEIIRRRQAEANAQSRPESLPATPAAIPEPITTNSPVSTPTTTVKSPKNEEKSIFNYKYNPNEPLPRLSPEEAAKFRKMLEQEENERKVKKSTHL